MKKLVCIMLTIAVIVFVGCGKEKTAKQKDSDVSSQPYRVEKMIYASEQKSCSCMLEAECIDAMAELVGMEDKTKAVMLYNVLLANEKIIIVRKNTKVACYYSEAYRGYVPVIFMEGEYKGRRAYVPPSRLGEIK